MLFMTAKCTYLCSQTLLRRFMFHPISRERNQGMQFDQQESSPEKVNFGRNTQLSLLEEKIEAEGDKSMCLSFIPEPVLCNYLMIFCFVRFANEMKTLALCSIAVVLPSNPSPQIIRQRIVTHCSNFAQLLFSLFSLQVRTSGACWIQNGPCAVVARDNLQ